MLINADLAQLAEHVTSNDEVGGSNPLVSIIKTDKAWYINVLRMNIRLCFCLHINVMHTLCTWQLACAQ